MKFIQKSSLQHIALVKIVIALWTQNNLRDLILNFSAPQFSRWQNIENRVIKKVPQLPVPERVKEKIISLVKPIGLQILKWMNYHCTDRYLQLDLPVVELSWTPRGTIDRKKTARVLIKDENLDIIKRYKLACIYCLKNDIQELWNNIPEDRREILSFEDSADNIQHFIWLYWTHIMQVGYNDPFYSSQHVVESCAKDGNKAATEYYLEELTPIEREEALVTSAQEEDIDAEVLCFLLSQMDEEQEKEVFKNNSYKVLLSFLDWPLQNFFSEVADRMWDYLSVNDFDRLLERIIVKIRDDYKDCNYEILFETFWQKSPSSFKSYVLGKRNSGFLLDHLLRMRDRDKIEFILQDATLAEKKELIYSDKMGNICRDLISNEEWDFLKFLIEQCLPSKNEMMKFKEEFVRHVANRSLKDYFTRNKQKWDELFFPPDASVRKSSKREFTEEIESHPSKRSRCTQ